MNKKTQLITILTLVVVVVGTFALLNRKDTPKEELGGMHRVGDITNLPEAQPMEIVELDNEDSYNLTADYVRKTINGTEYRMLAYNGSIPGPLIKVKQGSEVTINFTNNTDMKTLLHSHGVRMDNASDGSQSVQKEMEPRETFAYKITFPDAGVYWYHPHVREDYQQELGLYGNFLVEPNDPQYWNPVHREVTLFLDDILIEDGNIRLSKDGAGHALMGRFGNVMLMNGETDYQMDAKQGEVIRFYLTNSANTRTFNVFLKNVTVTPIGGITQNAVTSSKQSPDVKLKLVGNDNGKYEHETFVENVILGPSERVVVEVLFAHPGTYRLEHRTPQKTYPLTAVSVSNEPASPSYATIFDSLRISQDTIASIDPIRPFFDKPADKSLKLTVAMKSPMGSMSGGGQHMMHGDMVMDNAMMQMDNPQPIEWEDDMNAMNRNSTKNTLTWQMIDEVTGNVNMKIDDWKFKIGERVKIAIFNDPKSMHPMQHPIHIHGQRFLVLSTNGVANDNLVWKDTTLVKTGDSVEILIEMTNPGVWMIHCHIAEHLEAGMMMKFDVEE